MTSVNTISLSYQSSYSSTSICPTATFLTPPSTHPVSPSLKHSRIQHLSVPYFTSSSSPFSRLAFCYFISTSCFPPSSALLFTPIAIFCSYCPWSDWRVRIYFSFIIICWAYWFLICKIPSASCTWPIAIHASWMFWCDCFSISRVGRRGTLVSRNTYCFGPRS